MAQPRQDTTLPDCNPHEKVGAIRTLEVSLEQI